MIKILCDFCKDETKDPRKYILCFHDKEDVVASAFSQLTSGSHLCSKCLKGIKSYFPNQFTATRGKK